MNFRKAYSIFKNCIREGVPKLEKPKVIQFPVIDICNSRCQMCRIWENKKSTDITVEQLLKGLKTELFSEVEAIGFNGGEPTLRADLIDLVKVVVESLPSLKHISLITNAFKYKQVIQQIDDMAVLIKARAINFDVMVSLDGYEAVHDVVRGREGNFENAQHVIDHVLKSSLVDNVRIGCTVIRENVLHLAPLLEFCIARGVYIKYRLGVPHQRLYTQNLLDPYALTFEEKYEFVEFLEGLIVNYETSPQQNFFYRSLIDQIIHDKPRKAGCDWQHKGATITAKGELAYCAVQSKVLMPNIADGDPLSIYFAHEPHLKEIIKTKCDSCNHDYVGIPPASEYRKQLFARLDARLGLKRKARNLPFFHVLNAHRQKSHFANTLNYYRSLNTSAAPVKSSAKSVLICGWYGTETLGDKAILGGVIEAFCAALGDDTQIILVAINEYISRITQSQMPELKAAKVVGLSEGVRLSLSCDYVVFGGGPLMAINELAPMQVMFENAKKAGNKTVVAGCGVGPLGHKSLNDSIGQILKLADIRLYRDARSQEYAKNLGVPVVDGEVVEDPAFTWLARAEFSGITRDIAQPKKILLGLRDFPYKEYARHLSECESLKIKDNYEKVVVDALTQIVECYPEIKIVTLPMCTNHFGSDDRWFYRSLFRASNKLRSALDYSLLGAEMAPAAYLPAFQECDVLIAMRFHSLVFGISQGANSLALDYTLGKGKVRSLAERFDVPCLPLQNLTTESLVNEIAALLEAPRKKALTRDQLGFSRALAGKLIIK